MAAEASRSPAPSGDSYIGSLISLTSKCEIRYEGILYNINAEESCIGLRNVRSFGTEGRKEGLQIPASDKLYEYILFRGSDIKDLQVKSAPPTPPVHTPSFHNDPAIIQSHYLHPASTSASLPSAGNGAVVDPSSHTAQLGLPRSTFQGALPLYQPGGSLGSWGATPAPPTANGSGYAVPMYWQGFYAPSGGLPHLQPSSIPRPPPGLPLAQSMQQPLQYTGVNAALQSGSSNLPDFPPPLFPPAGSNQSLTSTVLQSGSYLPRPPPGLPLAQSMQQPLQYTGVNAALQSGSSNLPEFPPPLFPPASSTHSLTSTILPSTVAPTQASLLAPETASTLMPNMPHMTSLPAATLGVNLPLVPPLTPSYDPLTASSQNTPTVSSKPMTVSAPTLSYQTVSQSMPSVVGSSSSNPVESLVSLVTPDQLLQSSRSTIPSSQPLQTNNKYREVKPREVKKKPSAPESSLRAPAKAKESIPSLPESSARAPAKAREPILPLPKAMHPKTNGAIMQPHHYNRGRGRGRANGYSRPVTKFTEEFDFMAMNEKFNKDEVWGHLGKSNALSHNREGGENDDEADDNLEDDDAETQKPEVKPVYVKDDFFDTLSCNTLNRDSRGGRMRFSEQMKLDTETFGDFPRHRPIRGGGRGFRGGGRARGSYYGRGYGYAPRGRGHAVSNRSS